MFHVHLIDVICFIDSFSYVEQPLHFWDIPHNVIVYNPLNMLLDLILLMIF